MAKEVKDSGGIGFRALFVLIVWAAVVGSAAYGFFRLLEWVAG